MKKKLVLEHTRMILLQNKGDLEVRKYGVLEHTRMILLQNR